jgi:hypothetical protein
MQGLNRAIWSLSERQACAAIGAGHPCRQAPQRAVGQRNDKKLLTASAMKAMNLHFFAEQCVPGIANRDGARNVSSL